MANRLATHDKVQKPLDPRDHVLNLLSKSVNWLLIFDNYDDVTLNISSFLSPKLRGRILITSRDRQIIGSFANQGLHLSGLSPEEAVQLLLRSHQSSTAESMDTLAHPEYDVICQIIEELQSFPLAIDQAAAFIRENSPLTFSEYFEYLQPRSQNRESLMRFKELLPKYPDSVMTTWEISLKHLEQHHPRASRTLQILGFMSHSEIPEILLRETTKAIPWRFGSYSGLKSLSSEQISDLDYLTDDVHLRRAIGKLISLSMIQRATESSHGPLLSLHPLVHEWIRVRLNRTPDLQAKLTVDAVRILYHNFPIEAVARLQDEALDYSLDRKGRVDRTYLQLEFVIDNLKEYLDKTEFIPLEVSTLLAAVMLASWPQRGMGIFNYLAKNDSVKIQSLFELMHGLLLRSNSKYQVLLSIQSLGLKCLLSKNPNDTWSRVLTKISARFQDAHLDNSINTAEEQFLIVLCATVVDLADLGSRTTLPVPIPLKRVSEQLDRPPQNPDADQRRQGAIALLVSLRGFLNRLPLTSQMVSQLKLSTRFKLGLLMNPEEYWKDSDHYLTDTFSQKLPEDMNATQYAKGFTLAAKLHWDREGSKDSRGILGLIKMALEFSEAEFARCDMDFSTPAAMMSTRSNYLSSAFGRQGPTGFSVARSCQCRIAIHKLSYLWSIFLPAVDFLCLTSTSSRNVVEGLEVIEIIERFQQLIMKGEKHRWNLSEFVSSSSIFVTLAKTLFAFSMYRDALIFLWWLFDCRSVKAFASVHFEQLLQTVQHSDLVDIFLRKSSRFSPNGAEVNHRVIEPLWLSPTLGKPTKGEGGSEVPTFKNTEDPVEVEEQYAKVLLSSGFAGDQSFPGLNFDGIVTLFPFFLEAVFRMSGLNREALDAAKRKIRSTEALPMSIAKVQGRMEVIFCLAHWVETIPAVWTAIKNNKIGLSKQSHSSVHGLRGNIACLVVPHHATSDSDVLTCIFEEVYSGRGAVEPIAPNVEGNENVPKIGAADYLHDDEEFIFDFAEAEAGDGAAPWDGHSTLEDEQLLKDWTYTLDGNRKRTKETG